jgi:hypothetical protein
MLALNERRDAAKVRRRHGRAGDDVVGGSRRGGDEEGGPTANGHAGTSDVGLQDAGVLPVGPREEKKTIDGAEHCTSEHDPCHGVCRGVDVELDG